MSTENVSHQVILGYTRIDAKDQFAGCQVVDGEWYRPDFACDSLAMAIGESGQYVIVRVDNDMPVRGPFKYRETAEAVRRELELKSDANFAIRDQ